MPFPSIPTYDEFILSFGDHVYGETYMDLDDDYDEHADPDIFAEVRYIHHFLKNGLDPQVGLQKIVKRLVISAAASEYKKQMLNFVDIFIHAGASITPLMPFLTQVADDEDDEEDNKEFRAAVIERYSQPIELRNYIKKQLEKLICD